MEYPNNINGQTSEFIMKNKLFLLVFIMFFLTSCIKVDIKRSDIRKPVPKSLQLPNNIVITSWGAVDVKVFNKSSVFFPASFRIETHEKVIYIDPLEIEESKPADYIFITHAHEDHLSLSDIEKLVKNETLIIGPQTVVKQLSDHNTRNVKPGEVFELEDINCETVPAHNIRPIFLWIYPHPKKDMNVGYILTIDGVRIYHAGDTDPIPEIERIKDITVALVPLDKDGGKLTMDTEQAATLINTIRPKLAVPMHYELGKNYAEKFMRLVDEEIKVEIME